MAIPTVDWLSPILLPRWKAGARLRARHRARIGERVGNTQIDQMLVNLKLMGISPWAEQDLTN